MKNRLIIILLCCIFSGFAAGAQQWKQADFKALAAAKGLWMAKNTGGGLIEMWTIKSDSLMESKSYYVEGKKETLAETVQLIYSRGKIQYIVTVVGQNEEEPVIFELVSKKNKTFIFENKAHDFPQQIIYRFPKSKSMLVTISGTTGKGPKKVDFNFVQMKRRKYE